MRTHDGRAGTSFREILAAWVICSALYLLIALAPMIDAQDDKSESRSQQEAMSLDLTKIRE